VEPRPRPRAAPGERGADISPGDRGGEPEATPESRHDDAPTEPDLEAEFGTRPVVDRQQGKASYYADALVGRKTASGEVYRHQLHTAAHRTLPLGSVVRVKRSDGKATTYVRINDRGPFGSKGRIIDLSQSAAADLQMLRAGVLPVELEVLFAPEKKKRPRRRSR